MPGAKECLWRGDLETLSVSNRQEELVAEGDSSAGQIVGMGSSGSEGGFVKLNKSVWLQETGPGGREVGQSFGALAL